MNLNLSICVVTYNSDAYIARFHRELAASLAGHDDWEILYCDNSPDGGTAVVLRGIAGERVSVLEDHQNPGFSRANNRLIEQSRFANIALVNPDVFGFTTHFWPELLARTPAGSVRFIKLLNEDGSYQDCVGEVSSLARAFSGSPDYASLTQPTAVGMGIMAFMVTSRETLDRVGPLDESFPLYCEDMDWCYRARRLGIPLIYDPALTLTHVGAASAATRWDARTVRLKKYAAERIFIRKNYHGLYAVAMLLVNRLKLWRASL